MFILPLWMHIMRWRVHSELPEGSTKCAHSFKVHNYWFVVCRIVMVTLCNRADHYIFALGF